MSERETTIKSLAIIDDDNLTIASLSGLLRLETDYEVREYLSPLKALEELRQRPVDLVISDFLMPELNGIEFLREVKNLFPDVPRILLTGYADKDNAIESINELEIFQYIEKPWDNDSLLLVIKNAFNHHSLTRDLRTKLKELDNVLAQRHSLELDVTSYQEELHLARQAQLAMLPDCFPNLPNVIFSARYLPTLEVGGDYYDVAQSSDGRSVIIVADVSGHGIQAALGTMMVKGLFHEVTPQCASPDELLNALNNRLVQYFPKMMYTTATVCFVNAEATVVHLANAGGSYPIVIDEDNCIERVMLNGMPLGVFGSDTFKVDPTRKLSLKNGMTMLLHTDGLLDLENELGVRFEWTRLCQALKDAPRQSPQRLLDDLEEKLTAFRNGAKQLDDINIVVMQKDNCHG